LVSADGEAFVTGFSLPCRMRHLRFWADDIAL
jgi:hypothetical protein